MAHIQYEVISDEKLVEALEAALEEKPLKSNPQLAKLISMMMDRLIETGAKFNRHGHTTRTNFRGDEYESAGSGFAGPPADQGGYGCHGSVTIGMGE